MGEVVGAGLLAHVPTIMLPPEDAPGAQRGQGDLASSRRCTGCATEVFEQLDYDTVVVLDSHWATTVEFVVTAHGPRAPACSRPRSCRAACAASRTTAAATPSSPRRCAPSASHGTWITPIDDPYLPLYYAIDQPVEVPRRGPRQAVDLDVASARPARPTTSCASAARSATRSPQTDRKVMLIASGALSHTFWPLRELRDHEASDPSHIFTPEARDADHERLAWFKEGDHDRVLDTMPEFCASSPRRMFAHYLMMAGALGESDCSRTGRQYGDYENSIGTGQVHVWFDRPAAGLTGRRHARGPATSARPSPTDADR